VDFIFEYFSKEIINVLIPYNEYKKLTTEHIFAQNPNFPLKQYGWEVSDQEEEEKKEIHHKYFVK